MEKLSTQPWKRLNQLLSRKNTSNTGSAEENENILFGAQQPGITSGNIKKLAALINGIKVTEEFRLPTDKEIENYDPWAKQPVVAPFDMSTLFKDILRSSNQELKEKVLKLLGRREEEGNKTNHEEQIKLAAFFRQHPEELVGMMSQMQQVQTGYFDMVNTTTKHGYQLNFPNELVHTHQYDEHYAKYTREYTPEVSGETDNADESDQGGHSALKLTVRVECSITYDPITRIFTTRAEVKVPTQKTKAFQFIKAASEGVKAVLRTMTGQGLSTKIFGVKNPFIQDIQGIKEVEFGELRKYSPKELAQVGKKIHKFGEQNWGSLTEVERLGLVRNLRTIGQALQLKIDHNEDTSKRSVRQILSFQEGTLNNPLAIAMEQPFYPLDLSRLFLTKKLNEDDKHKLIRQQSIYFGQNITGGPYEIVKAAGEFAKKLPPNFFNAVLLDTDIEYAINDPEKIGYLTIIKGVTCTLVNPSFLSGLLPQPINQE